MRKGRVLTLDDIETEVRALVKLHENVMKPSTKVYGVPRGGERVVYVMESLGLCVREPDVSKAEVIVDDVVDSGSTRQEYLDKHPDKPFVALFERGKNMGSDDWILFPWEENSVEEEAKKLIVRTFEFIGEDPNRTGIKETPRRVVKMWGEIFRGYDPKLKPKITVFPNGEDGVVYDQMICDSGKFNSMCEHHMLPFTGVYWFAYIPDPNGLVIGLSKVARIVDYYSAKLQIQERLGKEILQELKDALTSSSGVPPLGMALSMEATHMCKTMRGVKKEGKMRTLIVDGIFKENNSVKSEFMDYVNRN